MALRETFCAVGCNNGSHCMSQAVRDGDAYKVASASATSVSIASFGASPAITHTLHGHSARVSCVTWHHSAKENFIVSGDALGHVLLWARTEAESNWASTVLMTSTASVSALACLTSQTRMLVFVATSNGDITVVDATTRESTTLALGERRIAEALAATVDASGKVVLALGGVDMHVHLYVVNVASLALTSAVSMSGHKGWVRDLAFSPQLDSGELLLASASQDHKIRLWRVATDMTMTFDAMLLGHDDWVTSVSWLPSGQLLSSSMDNRLILWQDEDHVWRPQTRIGDLDGAGLLGATACGADFLALTFGGEIYRWAQRGAHYVPARSVTGHTSSVTDVSWAPSGEYFVSVSLDQTARAFAVGGYEVSRAQVHGYDIQCGTFLTADHFVSGADEKILRVFSVPPGMADLLRGAAYGAGFGVLPELSLTNKRQEVDDSVAFVGEQLAKRSLWPEVQKLYGHGNELLRVASCRSGARLASACKARDEAAATVWLWRKDEASGSLVACQQLQGHASSIVQLAFSADDRWLASVSKDRHVCIYGAQDDGNFKLVHKAKAHKRIIWGCAWLPDQPVLATGSRDETVALWGLVGNVWMQVAPLLSFGAAVTAVAIAAKVNGHYPLVVGLETGELVACHIVPVTTGEFQIQIGTRVKAHASTVTRLAWHPSSLSFLSASADSSLKAFMWE
ncbi:elongator complex protein [Achlya hypogyna]|uniref:Elongator complex protein 2 n=1 Tax=Achlya hypogyna TaxID=1202772 RepID=A0A1V9Y5I2_ACHHY|nr:elongator complex protein [Achlya hypogyna]